MLNKVLGGDRTTLQALIQVLAVDEFHDKEADVPSERVTEALRYRVVSDPKSALMISRAALHRHRIEDSFV